MKPYITGARILPYDTRLLFPVLFLVGIGIVMIFSASSELALKKFGSNYFFVQKQVIFAMLGVVVMIICTHFPYRLFRHLSYVFLLIAMIFLIAVHVSGLGHEAGGASRWLRFKSISFQPAEFARFALIIYLAYSMNKKKDRIREFSIGFVPHVLVLFVFSVLIFMQPDFGSAVILFAITWIMMFVGGVRPAYLFSSLLLLLPAAAILMVTAEYRLKRLLSFMDPWLYPTNEGYQIVHSLMAFGTGGLWGTGIGQGYQKLFYLPEPHTDFIFSVIGEELGLWGVCFILGLYFMILWRGISIARNSDDLFGSYIALGLTVSMGLQVCINMGVTLGLLPTKGLTLPFLSYGGTSLLMNMACVGILMNISTSQSR